MHRSFSLLVFVIAVAVFASGGDKTWWKTGRLAKFGSDSWTSSANTPVTCSGTGSATTCSGGNTVNWNHVTYHAIVTEGKNTIYAYRTLNWRWQRSPKLTENTTVKFAIDGNRFSLVDEDGREFKMSVGKKRQNTPAEQLEECRNAVIELHQEFASPDALEDSLRQMSGQDLFNTFTSNLQCSNLSMQFQDWGLLTQFEAARLAMLRARISGTSSLGTQPQAETQVCEETIAYVKSNTVSTLTADQLSEKALSLYRCAMSDYQHGEDKWFVRTGLARNLLLTEIVARQSGAGIGEHYTTPQPAKP